MAQSEPGRKSPSSRTNPTPRRARSSSLWSIAAVLVALLLAAEIARLTVASEVAETRPALASTLAPNSPQVLFTTAMAEVGQAAAESRLPEPATMERLRSLARSAPLHPQPLLVDAALAQKNGDWSRAEQLLVEARNRDPRSPAARYLLADLWLAQGRVVDGLGELAILTRVMRSGAVNLVPALAQLANSPGGPEQLRQVLGTHPQLAQPLLNALAADPANAELVLKLSGAAPSRNDGEPPPWQERLLKGMVEQGDYQGAYGLWRRFSGISAATQPLLYNGEFRELPAPPPFDWTFASSGAGFAEPGNGSMRVIHYGRKEAVLASQLLLLPQGRYRFSAPVAGSPAPASLVWQLKCTGGATLAELDISQASAATFEVPGGNCPAQTLELRGRAQDMPQESDVRIGPASIERAGA